MTGMQHRYHGRVHAKNCFLQVHGFLYEIHVSLVDPMNKPSIIGNIIYHIEVSGNKSITAALRTETGSNLGKVPF